MGVDGWQQMSWMRSVFWVHLTDCKILIKMTRTDRSILPVSSNFFCTRVKWLLGVSQSSSYSCSLQTMLRRGVELYLLAQFDPIPTETTSCRCHSMLIKSNLLVYITHALHISIFGFNGCTTTAPFFLTKLSSTLQVSSPRPSQPNIADDNKNNDNQRKQDNTRTKTTKSFWSQHLKSKK